jgi:hypothetical protein
VPNRDLLTGNANGDARFDAATGTTIQSTDIDLGSSPWDGSQQLPVQAACPWRAPDAATAAMTWVESVHCLSPALARPSDTRRSSTHPAPPAPGPPRATRAWNFRIVHPTAR